MKPLGSKLLQNIRLNSQIPILFNVFCNLPRVIVSCCALDCSKTQTALTSAMFASFLKPLGSTFLQNWRQPLVTPSVSGHVHGRWSRPPSLVTLAYDAPCRKSRPPVAGHATCRWSRPRSLVKHRSHCIQIVTFNSMCYARLGPSGMREAIK